MPFLSTLGNAFATHTILPYGLEGIGAVVGESIDAASTTWIGAQTAIYTPFRIGRSVLIKGFFWLNGATVSGNVDCGIYGSGGTWLVSTGATAQSGTNVIQTVTLGTPYALSAQGSYFYLGIMLTSATGTLFGSSGLNDPEAQLLGIIQQSSVGTTLPTTLTAGTIAGAEAYVYGAFTVTAP